MGMKAEIHEQPAVLERFLANELDAVRAVAAQVREHRCDLVYVLARGSSDNAGRYGKYLFGIENRLPVAMGMPSLFSMYDAPPRLENAFVLGISQSGQSPDIVAGVEEGRRQGAVTVAVTNEPDSPLAKAAGNVIRLHAGAETAVAATKTYTAQLGAVAALSACLADDEAPLERLRAVPAAVEAALGADAAAEEIAGALAAIDRAFVLGRGYHYATAYEWSLKLKELCYLSAEPYSPADFLHGPVAVVDDGFPVFANLAQGRVRAEVLDVLAKIRAERGADLAVVTDRADDLPAGARPLVVPQVDEWLSPLVGIVPAQLLCYHLTSAKGLDTERPRGLSKVTRTR